MPAMTERGNERVAYFNGEIVAESRVAVSFRDSGFLYGDGVFDTARTFGHKPFRLDDHVKRLFRSLRATGIDPGLTPEKTIEITEEVLARNLHLIDPEDDYWVTQRVTRGVKTIEGDLTAVGAPTVIVECTPLPIQARARLFRDGIDVVVPSVRRVPPEALSPRIKTQNYLNLVMADREAKARTPESWAILLDMNGNLCEGMGSNIFLVRDGRLLTPKARGVLPGISRQTVIELAEDLGIPVEETDLDLYDAYTSDEAFLTSTSLCLCGVCSVNGQALGAGAPPGPITARLTEAYKALAGFDFVAQYLNRLDGSG
jgi:branched-chain amino acid aminotransferase